MEHITRTAKTSNSGYVENGGIRRFTPSEWIDRNVRSAEENPVSFPVELTPELAAALLERNENNRNFTESRVQNLVTDILSGRWQFNGEPLIVSRDGLLNDGQHRCRAVVESGRSIRTMISFGFDRESRMTLDQGAVRTAGNYLSMEGLPSGNHMAAVAGLIWMYLEHGRIGSSGNERPTKSQILHIAQSYGDIHDSLLAAGKTNGVMSKSMLAFCHWVFSRKSHPNVVKYFIDKLIDGTELPPKSPILYARNRLGKDRLTSNEKLHLVFRAWNAYRRGDKVTSLPINPGKLPKLER